MIDFEGGYYDALLATSDDDDDEASTSVAAAIAAAVDYEEAALIAAEDAAMDAITAPIPAVVTTPTRQLSPAIQQAISRHNPYASEGLRRRFPQTGPTGPIPGA
jgi:hypothetical protein